MERGSLEFDEKWMPAERRQQIEAVIARLETNRMKTLKEALPEAISYGEIRLVAAKLAKSNA